MVKFVNILVLIK